MKNINKKIKLEMDRNIYKILNNKITSYVERMAEKYILDKMWFYAKTIEIHTYKGDAEHVFNDNCICINNLRYSIKQAF